MILLYFFMLFVSEEVWYGLKECELGDDCCVSVWLIVMDFDVELIKCVELV